MLKGRPVWAALCESDRLLRDHPDESSDHQPNTGDGEDDLSLDGKFVLESLDTEHVPTLTVFFQTSVIIAGERSSSDGILRAVVEKEFGHDFLPFVCTVLSGQCELLYLVV